MGAFDIEELVDAARDVLDSRGGDIDDAMGDGEMVATVGTDAIIRLADALEQHDPPEPVEHTVVCEMSKDGTVEACWIDYEPNNFHPHRRIMTIHILDGIPTGYTPADGERVEVVHPELLRNVQLQCDAAIAEGDDWQKHFNAACRDIERISGERDTARKELAEAKAELGYQTDMACQADVACKSIRREHEAWKAKVLGVCYSAETLSSIQGKLAAYESLVALCQPTKASRPDVAEAVLPLDFTCTDCQRTIEGAHQIITEGGPTNEWQIPPCDNCRDTARKQLAEANKMLSESENVGLSLAGQLAAAQARLEWFKQVGSDVRDRLNALCQPAQQEQEE